MILKKKLTRHGNSLALIIDRPMLDMLDIDGSTPLIISSSDGHSLVITPENKMPKKRNRFEKELARVNKKYRPVLKKLAGGES